MNLNLSFNLDSSALKKTALDQDTLYDLLIVGSGPAGLNAALYGARKGLKLGILGMKKGGQVLDTSSVDNFIGVEDISGEALAERFSAHVKKLQVPIYEESEVIDYYLDNNIHHVVLSSGETYKAKAMILATGSKPRKLDVPGEKEYAGKGVAYCAICDGPLFKDKDVFVAGGGNSAVEAALDLSKIARSVSLVHRSLLRADQILIDQMTADPKITVHLKTTITEIVGDKAMTGIRVEDANTGDQRVLEGDGIFIEIGYLPNTGPFKKHVEVNTQGEILTSPRKETNVPGLFAAGDVTSFPYKQIVIAASDGAIAALAANDYIQKHGL